MSIVENFLAEFGASILKLSTFAMTKVEYLPQLMVCSANGNYILKLIEKYCKNLIGLEIRFGEIHKNTFNEFRALFKRLKMLHVFDISNKSIFQMISVCSELEVLKIYLRGLKRNEKYDVPKIALPKLIEFQLRDVSEVEPNDYSNIERALIQFFKLNTNLRKLYIENTNLLSAVLKSINGFEQLNEIKLGFIDFESQMFHELSRYPNVKLNLKFVNVDIDSYFIRIMSTLNNITTLDILDFYPLTNANNLIDLLKVLPNIENLGFCQQEHDYFDVVSKCQIVLVKTILQHAKKLSQLTLSTKNRTQQIFSLVDPALFCPINENDYDDILESPKNIVKIAIS